MLRARGVLHDVLFAIAPSFLEISKDALQLFPENMYTGSTFEYLQSLHHEISNLLEICSVSHVGSATLCPREIESVKQG